MSQNLKMRDSIYYAWTVSRMAYGQDLSPNVGRLVLEAIPDDAMRYVCPVCLEEGAKPSVIRHHPHCAYLKRREGNNG
ncbi:MAG: hypothetical protein ACXV2D_05630 [Halobacteriota archaeon]